MDTNVFSRRSEAAISTITAFIVSCLIYQGFSSMRDMKQTTVIKAAFVEVSPDTKSEVCPVFIMHLTHK